MNTRFWTLALLASASMSASAAETVTLHVVVHGLKTATGHIRACVFRTANNFPDCDKGTGVVSVSVPADAPQVTFDIPGVTPGAAAVAVYVDVNDNRRIDKGFMGIPEEPLGFSNNPVVTLGLPSYKDSEITIGANTTTMIRLKHF